MSKQKQGIKFNNAFSFWKDLITVSGYKHEQVWTNIGEELIWKSNDAKLLGIAIDGGL